jgi:hypothetical protein
MIIPAPAIFQERGEAPLNALLEKGGDHSATPESAAEAEISFWDLLDVVNPLQHIPVVSSVYRQLSGDEIGGMARLAGGFLFGGPIGLASSAANLGIEAATGMDLGAHIMSALDSDGTGQAGDAGMAARAASVYGEEGGLRPAAGNYLDIYDIDVPN